MLTHETQGKNIGAYFVVGEDTVENELSEFARFDIK